LGLIAAGFEREHFQEMMNEFRSIDFETYFDLLFHLGAHDAEHMLSSIFLPTLVVGGTRDVITPPWFSRRIAHSIPGADLFMITGGTHYSAAEYPNLIAERIERFLQRHRPV
jgi:pimeloyl-ACP methyl ester carboxylesterase